MNPQYRTVVLVELLARNAEARRAVVSWALVPPALTGLRMLDAWARAAGVPLQRLTPLADMLFEHRVCMPDRTADAEALRLIEHVAANSMRRKGTR